MSDKYCPAGKLPCGNYSLVSIEDYPQSGQQEQFLGTCGANYQFPQRRILKTDTACPCHELQKPIKDKVGEAFALYKGRIAQDRMSGIINHDYQYFKESLKEAGLDE